MLGKGPGQNCWSINNSNNINSMLFSLIVFTAPVVQSYRPVCWQYCHIVPPSSERGERRYLSPASGSLTFLVSSSGQQLKRRDLRGKVEAADRIHICICTRVFISIRKKGSSPWTHWLLPLDQYFSEVFCEMKFIFMPHCSLSNNLQQSDLLSGGNGLWKVPVRYTVAQSYLCQKLFSDIASIFFRKKN